MTASSNNDPNRCNTIVCKCHHASRPRWTDESDQILITSLEKYIHGKTEPIRMKNFRQNFRKAHNGPGKIGKIAKNHFKSSIEKWLKDGSVELARRIRLAYMTASKVPDLLLKEINLHGETKFERRKLVEFNSRNPSIPSIPIVVQPLDLTVKTSKTSLTLDMTAVVMGNMFLFLFPARGETTGEEHEVLIQNWANWAYDTIGCCYPNHLSSITSFRELIDFIESLRAGNFNQNYSDEQTTAMAGDYNDILRSMIMMNQGYISEVGSDQMSEYSNSQGT